MYHEHILKLIEERPWLWATHVWNLFDFAADGRDEGGKKGENQKGLVEFDHKTKKDAFYLYKAAWSKEPFVHLCGKRYSDRAEEKTQIIREIEYFLSFYRPVPKTMIAYDREAYFGREDPNFRMTLDRRIRYREDDLVLSDGDRGTLLDKNGGYLLEIKVNGAMPLFMSRILTGLRIYPVSFSKVGKAYEIIHGGETHKLMNVYGYERNSPLRGGGSHLRTHSRLYLHSRQRAVHEKLRRDPGAPAHPR